jgi:hypothetical protein
MSAFFEYADEFRVAVPIEPCPPLTPGARWSEIVPGPLGPSWIEEQLIEGGSNAFGVLPGQDDLVADAAGIGEHDGPQAIGMAPGQTEFDGGGVDDDFSHGDDPAGRESPAGKAMPRGGPSKGAA